MSAFSNSVCVYFMHMYQHARSKSFISCILVFNTENDCLPSSGFLFFFFFFLVNYVKVLELYWLLTILKQNKTIWIVLQRMTLFRDGTKLSSILFIPLNDFGAGTWDFLIYSMILHICSSQHEHEAQWHQVTE